MTKRALMYRSQRRELFRLALIGAQFLTQDQDLALELRGQAGDRLDRILFLASSRPRVEFVRLNLD
jgi:hypothetical protein